MGGNNSKLNNKNRGVKNGNPLGNKCRSSSKSLIWNPWQGSPETEAVTKETKETKEPSISKEQLMTKEEFASIAVEVVEESHGKNFFFKFDRENFCIEFRLKSNDQNCGKLFLENRWRCMLAEGKKCSPQRVRRIVKDSTEGLHYYQQPVPDVDASSLHLLYPMIKTPKWFETYSDAMQSYGCQDSIVRRKVKGCSSIGWTLMVNHGKFRRFVSEAELKSWKEKFKVDPLEESMKNLTKLFQEKGSFKQIWGDEQGSCLYVAQMPDELSASLILHQDVIRRLKVKGSPVVAMPVPSILYITGSKDAAALQTMSQLIKGYRQYPHFLTLESFQLQKSGSWCSLGEPSRPSTPPPRVNSVSTPTPPPRKSKTTPKSLTGELGSEKTTILSESEIVRSRKGNQTMGQESKDWELEIVSSMLDVANQIDDEIPSQLRIRMNRQRKQPDANVQFYDALKDEESDSEDDEKKGTQKKNLSKKSSLDASEGSGSTSTSASSETSCQTVIHKKAGKKSTSDSKAIVQNKSSSLYDTMGVRSASTSVSSKISGKMVNNKIAGTKQTESKAMMQKLSKDSSLDASVVLGFTSSASASSEIADKTVINKKDVKKQTSESTAKIDNLTKKRPLDTSVGLELTSISASSQISDKTVIEEKSGTKQASESEAISQNVIKNSSLDVTVIAGSTSASVSSENSYQTMINKISVTKPTPESKATKKNLRKNSTLDMPIGSGLTSASTEATCKMVISKTSGSKAKSESKDQMIQNLSKRNLLNASMESESTSTTASIEITDQTVKKKKTANKLKSESMTMIQNLSKNTLVGFESTSTAASSETSDQKVNNKRNTTKPTLESMVMKQNLSKIISRLTSVSCVNKTVIKEISGTKTPPKPELITSESTMVAEVSRIPSKEQYIQEHVETDIQFTTLKYNSVDASAEFQQMENETNEMFFFETAKMKIPEPLSKNTNSIESINSSSADDFSETLMTEEEDTFFDISVENDLPVFEHPVSKIISTNKELEEEVKYETENKFADSLEKESFDENQNSEDKAKNLETQLENVENCNDSWSSTYIQNEITVDEIEIQLVPECHRVKMTDVQEDQRVTRNTKFQPISTNSERSSQKDCEFLEKATKDLVEITESKMEEMKLQESHNDEDQFDSELLMALLKDEDKRRSMSISSFETALNSTFSENDYQDAQSNNESPEPQSSESEVWDDTVSLHSNSDASEASLDTDEEVQIVTVQSTFVGIPLFIVSSIPEEKEPEKDVSQFRANQTDIISKTISTKGYCAKSDIQFESKTKSSFLQFNEYQRPDPFHFGDNVSREYPTEATTKKCKDEITKEYAQIDQNMNNVVNLHEKDQTTSSRSDRYDAVTLSNDVFSLLASTESSCTDDNKETDKDESFDAPLACFDDEGSDEADLLRDKIMNPPIQIILHDSNYYYAEGLETMMSSPKVSQSWNYELRTIHEVSSSQEMSLDEDDCSSISSTNTDELIRQVKAFSGAGTKPLSFSGIDSLESSPRDSTESDLSRWRDLSVSDLSLKLQYDVENMDDATLENLQSHEEEEDESFCLALEQVSDLTSAENQEKFETISMESFQSEDGENDRSFSLTLENDVDLTSAENQVESGKTEYGAVDTLPTFETPPQERGYFSARSFSLESEWSSEESACEDAKRHKESPPDSTNNQQAADGNQDHLNNQDPLALDNVNTLNNDNSNADQHHQSTSCDDNVPVIVSFCFRSIQNKRYCKRSASDQPFKDGSTERKIVPTSPLCLRRSTSDIRKIRDMEIKDYTNRQHMRENSLEVDEGVSVTSLTDDEDRDAALRAGCVGSTLSLDEDSSNENGCTVMTVAWR